MGRFIAHMWMEDNDLVDGDGFIEKIEIVLIEIKFIWDLVSML